MDYEKEYTKLHKKSEGIFSGNSLLPHIAAIDDLIKATKAKTLLDYGCGKAHPYLRDHIHDRWGIPRPYLYDVGVKRFSALPTGQFDGVICTDVLEHIAEPDLPQLIERLYSYTGKFLFLSIATRPAKKKFKDGTNVHLTIRPRDWWRELLMAHYPESRAADQLIIRTVYMEEA